MPAPAPTTPPAVPHPRPLPVRPRVLIVDDDRAVARAVARLVRDLGHEPVLARGALDAMSALRHGTVFHAVITDHDLGAGETGASLLARVRAAYPTTKRVLMSGSEASVSTRAGVAHGALLKPLERDALARLLA